MHLHVRAQDLVPSPLSLSANRSFRMGRAALGAAFVMAGLLAAPAVARAEAPTARAEDPADHIPARPPLPDVTPPPDPAWQRHLELGGDVAFVARPSEGNSGIEYEPTVGFGLHIRWALFDYLRIGAYFVDARHSLTIPPGSLGIQGDMKIGSVYTFAFGARLSPTLPLGKIGRAWLTGGIGYGRLEFPEMEVTTTTGNFTVRDRTDPFVEAPIGGGVSFDLWKARFTLDFELTGAFVFNQPGDAFGDVQAFDPQGRRIRVAGFPELGASFVQTVGLSLVL